jgi:hypothetical protein
MGLATFTAIDGFGNATGQVDDDLPLHKVAVFE